MKIVASILFVFCILFLGNVTIFNSTNVINAEKEVPSYAKWGSIAMRETKERYPNTDIIDYLHIGRETRTRSSTEKFKLWLKEDNKEFGVFVDIEFDNVTEHIIDITFRETPR